MRVPTYLTWFAYLVLGAFGLLFGSFANVLIWRVPRGESIVSPGSHCPRCEHPIRWYDNVPLVSWLVLGGKCRDCGEPIAWRYPAVELASGLLWVLALWRWGISPQLPLAIVFLYMLLVLSVIDLDTRRLPTPLVMVIAIAGVVGVLLSLVTTQPFGPITQWATVGLWANPAFLAGVGFVSGGGIAIAIAGLYGMVRKVEGLGFGDVRLLGAMGIVLGPYVLLAYALANILGVFGAIPALLAVRKARVKGAAQKPPLAIPFGPFLALAGLLTALWGPTIWAAYLRTIGLA